MLTQVRLVCCVCVCMCNINNQKKIRGDLESKELGNVGVEGITRNGEECK